jgi:hypothetical protein
LSSGVHDESDWDADSSLTLGNRTVSYLTYF